MASMGGRLSGPSYKKYLNGVNLSDGSRGRKRIIRPSQGTTCEIRRVGSSRKYTSIKTNGRETGTMNYSTSDGIISMAQTENRVQLSDVIDWFINLPWPKMASWMLVIAVASQLKEFLGVRCILVMIIVSFISVDECLRSFLCSLVFGQSIELLCIDREFHTRVDNHGHIYCIFHRK